MDDIRLAQIRQSLAEPLDHPDTKTLRADGEQTLAWLLHHFETLPEQTIGQTASRPAMEQLLREPPPEQGCDFGHVLAEFEQKVAPHAFRTNHPRFFAFVPGAPNFYSVLGDFLCAGTNFFGGVWLEAAAVAQVEIVVLDWFANFLGCPAETRGLLTSGGSEANLTALLVARERLSFEERPRAVLYVNEHRHWSLDRAAMVAGFRPDQTRQVAADAAYRLAPAALAAAVRQDREAGRLPWLVAATAGATNTGTVDPLELLAEFCARERLWFHVDAAYGWAAALDEEGRTRMRGIERADSITLDPHKWFGQTFEAGCVLIREGRRLGETFAQRPEYMQDVLAAADEINFADQGLALTRRFRALKIWLSVKVLGVRWYRDLVRRCCRLADYAQALLERAGCFAIVSPRQLSIVGFQYQPRTWPQPASDRAVDRLNLALLEELRRSGRAFLSSTRLHGRVVLRFCFVNWRTTARDLDEVVQLLATLGSRLEREMG